MDFKRTKLLYGLIAKNQSLSKKRHPMFEKSTFMKFFIYIFMAFWAVYLFFLGIALYAGFEESSREPYDMINGGMIVLLALDFYLRFGMQETPAQEIRPYKLLPIPQKFLLNVFLVRMALRPYNLFWHFLLVPIGFLSVPRFFGISGFVGFFIGWWLVFVVNSYWYLIWRTLVNKHVMFVSIPTVVYAALIYFGFFHFDGPSWLAKASMIFGQGLIGWNLLCYGALVLLLVLLFYVNRVIQARSVYAELAKEEKVSKVKSIRFGFLDRFGEVGEYMKLEIKSALRNSVVRKQFLMGIFYMLLLSAMFAFSDVYDSSPFWKVFICVYSFSCLGVMTLTNVMCSEGNYIDGLMSRKESVLSILRAKYYFNVIMMVIPLIFMMMPVSEGKVSAVMVFGCLFFSAGVVFACLFQLAVYNNNTIHLNEKLTRSGRGTRMQMLISMVSMFAPMIVMMVLINLFSEQTASLVLLLIGVAGTLLHPLWLRNIYKRFMKRRYENMAGFRESRNV